MSRVLSADFFEFRKSKMTFLLPLIAILLGFAIPLMYYGICEMFRFLSDAELFGDDPSLSLAVASLDALNARAVFLSALPLSQGVGIVLTAMIGFRAVRPFSTGAYRNKVIAQVPRGAIYLSQSLFCLILMMVSACLYTLCAALGATWTFGDLGFSGREIAVIALLSAGIYLVYTAIPVFVAFLTRSTPLSILVPLLLPVLTQTIVSFVAAPLSAAPEIVTSLLAVIPAFQNIYMLSCEASDPVLAVALSADVVLAALLTLIGILRYKKSDMN